MTEPQEPRSATSNHLTSAELSEYAYSPETTAASLREHAEGCAECAGEVEELRLLLSALAELPEPALPVEVGIRLDAALARAWQEADAERQAAAAGSAQPGAAGAGAAAGARRGRRLSWRKLAFPLGALGVLVLAGVGLGKMISHSGGSFASSSGAAAQGGGDAALTQWVRSVLPGAASADSGVGPQVQGGPKRSTAGSAPSGCASYPQRAGYHLLTVSRRDFDERPATLVVYQNDTGPASSTVFAVVYAGPSCPTGSSEILDQGPVSR